ncbi:MAG TPA: FHA domain-containing protein, partial [Pirellulaceae bacterium]
MSSTYCYLTMVIGPRSGTNFLLDGAATNRLGRGIDCDIVLTDPMWSRVHAELTVEDGKWILRDAESRNGTFLDGK